MKRLERIEFIEVVQCCSTSTFNYLGELLVGFPGALAATLLNEILYVDYIDYYISRTLCARITQRPLHFMNIVRTDYSHGRLRKLQDAWYFLIELCY